MGVIAQKSSASMCEWDQIVTYNNGISGVSEYHFKKSGSHNLVGNDTGSSYKLTCSQCDKYVSLDYEKYGEVCRISRVFTTLTRIPYINIPAKLGGMNVCC